MLSAQFSLRLQPVVEQSGPGSNDFQVLKGDTLAQKIGSINMSDWQNNTNLQAAFNHVLEIAIRNHVPAEEMPKSLIVISDMEIDSTGDKEWTFYEMMAQRFMEYGYRIPNVIFWNVASRNDVFHADKTRIGVQLVSGQSATTFRHVLQCVGMNPVEAMEKIINSEFDFGDDKDAARRFFLTMTQTFKDWHQAAKDSAAYCELKAKIEKLLQDAIKQ